MLLRTLFRFGISWILVCLSLPVCLGQSAVDLGDRSVDPVKANSGKVVVLIFVRRDCPISGRYAPTIQRISAEHEKDARFYLVFPDKDESAGDIQKYLHDFHYSLPALRDKSHALVKEARAQITPESAVFNAKGDLVYYGRIDDLFVTFGKARSAPTTHELEDAINDAVAGRSLAKNGVAGVGCYISDLE
ncbi:MAG TPA: redoxin family protein [Terriglobales bacterium]